MLEDFDYSLATLRLKLASLIKQCFGIEYDSNTEGLLEFLLVASKNSPVPDYIQQLRGELDSISPGLLARDSPMLFEIYMATVADRLCLGKDAPNTNDVLRFAYQLGRVDREFENFIPGSKKKKKGGDGRAAKIKEMESIVIEKAKAIDGWETKSAESLAGDLLGVMGIDFAHRKITDTIREYRKKQGALHPAQDA